MARDNKYLGFFLKLLSLRLPTAIGNHYRCTRALQRCAMRVKRRRDHIPMGGQYKPPKEGMAFEMFSCRELGIYVHMEKREETFQEKGQGDGKAKVMFRMRDNLHDLQLWCK